MIFRLRNYIRNSRHEIEKFLRNFRRDSKNGVSYEKKVYTFHLWFSLHIFVNFMKEEPFTQFYGHELMKLRSFERLNCVSK